MPRANAVSATADVDVRMEMKLQQVVRMRDKCGNPINEFARDVLNIKRMN